MAMFSGGQYDGRTVMRELTYRCSTGEEVTESEIWSRFDDGSWTPYSYDTEDGSEWVRAGDGSVIKLRPLR